MRAWILFVVSSEVVFQINDVLYAKSNYYKSLIVHPLVQYCVVVNVKVNSTSHFMFASLTASILVYLYWIRWICIDLSISV